MQKGYTPKEKGDKRDTRNKVGSVIKSVYVCDLWGLVDSIYYQLKQEKESNIGQIRKALNGSGT